MTVDGNIQKKICVFRECDEFKSCQKQSPLQTNNYSYFLRKLISSVIFMLTNKCWRHFLNFRLYGEYELDQSLSNSTKRSLNKRQATKFEQFKNSLQKTGQSIFTDRPKETTITFVRISYNSFGINSTIEQLFLISKNER